MTLIRNLVVVVLVLVGAAATAEAAPLTLYFSGSVDLTLSGGTDDNPFSGFFTWDTTTPPFDVEPGVGMYPTAAHQLIFNGVEVDQSLGAGVFVINNLNAFGTGIVDAFMVFIVMKTDPVLGETAFIGGLSGPATTWNTIALPTNYNFLSQLTTRFSLVSLETPEGGDEDDILLGRGSYAVLPAPEPATLTLTALGLAGVVARARRRRQPR